MEIGAREIYGNELFEDKKIARQNKSDGLFLYKKLFYFFDSFVLIEILKSSFPFKNGA